MKRALAALLCAASCAAPPVPAPPPEPSLAGPPSALERGSRGPASLDAEFAWRTITESPQPSPAFDPDLVALEERCGTSDRALAAVALRMARRQVRGEPQMDVSEIVFAMRSEGAPHVWPRAWTLAGEDLDASDTVARFERFLASFREGGSRRCGLASVRTGSSNVLAAAVVDALADLEPVPMRARLGQWIDVSAKLLVEAVDAKLVVLGPRGAPRSVPTRFDGRRISGRFAVDAPGAWTAQVLAEVATGPRPVAEALVFVDAEPPSTFTLSAAPGETAADGAMSDEDSVARMVDAARASEHLSRLSRHAELDAIAGEHARAMHAAGVVGHDVGDGDPRSRVERAGIDYLATGENVARADTLTRAHRALWASPSHRGNLLLPRFEAIGVGVVRGADGSVWVCQVFADF